MMRLVGEVRHGKAEMVEAGNGEAENGEAGNGGAAR